MRIAFFTTDFPYLPPFDHNAPPSVDALWGGVAMVVYKLAMCLGNAGHEVHVFTTSGYKRDEVKRCGRVTVHRYRRTITAESTPVSVGLLLGPLLCAPDFDIIHIHMGSPPGAISGYIYATIRSRKYVLSLHGDPIADFGSGVRRAVMHIHNSCFAERILSRAEVLTTMSLEYLGTSELLRDYADKTIIIPNGVDIAEYEIPLSRDECRMKLGLPLSSKILLFVGNLMRLKGPQVLVRAMRLVLESVPEAFLVIVGDGIARAELAEMTERLGIGDRTVFRGFVTGEVKSLYYRSADVFVLPSYSEAFPITLLEASAAGLPLVVSDLNCLKAIVRDGWNGSVAETGNEIDLARRLIEILQDESAASRMGHNARRKAEDFSWEEIARAMENVYKRWG